MFSSGIYKNRLYKILISTGTIVIVLLAVLSGSYLHLQQKSSYIHNLSNSTAALEANSNIAMNLISRAVNDVSRDKSITKWVNSSSANDFYFNSITALKQLRIITTDSSMLNYELAVTTVPAFCVLSRFRSKRLQALPGQVSFCFTVTTGFWRSAIGKPIWMSFFQI